MKGTFWLTDILKKCGGFLLVGMMAVTCVDVVGRFFGHPIFGSGEIVTIMATLAISMGLAFTHQTGGHVGVEILIRLFPARTQTVIEICTNILSLALFVLVTWRMTVYAQTLQKTGEISMNLKIPVYLVVYAMSLCMIVLCLVILKEVVQNIKKLRAS
jgi:TRAP-type C4-dicarboxylate transport system permease small subunit